MIGNATLIVEWQFRERLKKSIRFQKSFHKIKIDAPLSFSRIADDQREKIEYYVRLRLQRKRIEPSLNKEVRELFDQNFVQSDVKRKFYLDDSHHHLQTYFDELNRHYFDNQCSIEAIGWSHQNTKKLLGKWCNQSKSIIISSFLNSAKVPRNTVEFIIYHEMCHQMFPPQQRKSRRLVHHRQFRENERRFEHYHSVRTWFLKQGLKL